MPDKTPEPPAEDTGADFTATATAPPGAFERLGENLARIEAGFAERDAREKH